MSHRGNLHNYKTTIKQQNYRDLTPRLAHYLLHKKGKYKEKDKEEEEEEELKVYFLTRHGHNRVLSLVHENHQRICRLNRRARRPGLSL